MKCLIFAATITLAAPATSAQQAVPTEFPPGAVSMTAEQLRSRLADRVFDAKMTDGGAWWYEYKSNGDFAMDTSRARDKGKWRTEGGKICVELQRFGSSCSEMRLVGDVLYLKRASNGEVVALRPR